MRIYLEALRIPHLARLIFSQLLARFPAGMLSVALLIHIEQTYGDYTVAGFTIAAFAVGSAMAGPLGGRLLSHFGMRPMLTATAVIHALSLALVALTTPPLYLLFPLVFVMGLSVPPIPPAVRTVYPKIVDGQRINTVFAIDATLQEAIWIIGPLLTTVIAATFSPRAAILLCSVVVLVGSAWFIPSKPIGQVHIPRSPRKLGAVLREPVVAIMCLICLFGVGMWGAFEAAAIAQFGYEDPTVGLAIGMSAVGSIIGGVIAGLFSMPKWSMAVRVSIGLVGAIMAVFVLDNSLLFIVAYFVAGMASAPMLSLANAAVSSAVRFSDTAEAFGWLGTSQLVGVAITNSIGGIAIDAMGPVGGLYVTVGSAATALLVAIVAMPWLPKLSQHEAHQRADTGTIVLPDPQQS